MTKSEAAAIFLRRLQDMGGFAIASSLSDEEWTSLCLTTINVAMHYIGRWKYTELFEMSNACVVLADRLEMDTEQAMLPIGVVSVLRRHGRLFATVANVRLGRNLLTAGAAPIIA